MSDLKDKLVWFGTFMDHGGYADMNRNYVKGLIEKGWPTRIEALMSNVTEITPDEAAYFNNLRVFDQHGRHTPILEPDVIKVVAHLPFERIPKFRRNVIFTMMECEKASPFFINRCNRWYDECWTPTHYNKKVFEEVGLNIECKVAPIGINNVHGRDDNIVDNFEVPVQKVFCDDAPDQPEGFRFLSIFRWTFRKGFDALLKAYLREFKKKDNVSLLIHSRHACMSHDQSFKDYVINDIHRIVSQNKLEDSAPVYLCQEIVPSALMPSYYRANNCFISCSRGEGFCMPALEASKNGLPIIVPNHTGFTDYVEDDNCYSFDVDDWVVCNQVEEWRNGGWITGDFHGQKFPIWGDKKVEEISSLMRQVYENESEAKKVNENMIKLIDERYSWDKCVDTVDGYLKEIVEKY